MSEETLSDKIVHGMIYHGHIKQFIKEIKEDINNPSGEVNCSVQEIFRLINKKAGDKLIE